MSNVVKINPELAELISQEAQEKNQSKTSLISYYVQLGMEVDSGSNYRELPVTQKRNSVTQKSNPSEELEPIHYPSQSNQEMDDVLNKLDIILKAIEGHLNTLSDQNREILAKLTSSSSYQELGNLDLTELEEAFSRSPLLHKHAQKLLQELETIHSPAVKNSLERIHYE